MVCKIGLECRLTESFNILVAAYSCDLENVSGSHLVYEMLPFRQAQLLKGMHHPGKASF